MTSWLGSGVRITGPLVSESTGHPVDSPHKGPVLCCVAFCVDSLTIMLNKQFSWCVNRPVNVPLVQFSYLPFQAVPLQVMRHDLSGSLQPITSVLSSRLAHPPLGGLMSGQPTASNTNEKNIMKAKPHKRLFRIIGYLRWDAICRAILPVRTPLVYTAGAPFTDNM